MLNDQINQALSDPLMTAAATLLGSAGPSNTPISIGQALGNAVTAYQGAQDSRNEFNIRKQQAEQQRQIQDAQMQKMQFDLAQAQSNASNISTLRNQIPGLLGEAPSVVNNFQGQGYLGGKISPEELKSQLNLLNLQYGDPNNALNDISRTYAPSEAGKVAAEMGLKPGTPEYTEAVRQLSGIGKFQNQQMLNEQKAQLEKGNVYNKYLAEQDFKKVDDQRQILQVAPTFNKTLDNLEQIVNSIPGWQLGQTVGDVSKRYNADVQKFMGEANYATATLRQLLSFPAAGFSDADREFLERLIGNPNTTKDAILSNLKRLKQKAQMNIDRASKMDSWYRANSGNLNGFEDFINEGRTETPETSLLGTNQAPAQQPKTGLLGLPILPGYQPSQKPRTVPNTSSSSLQNQPITKSYSYNAFER